MTVSFVIPNWNRSDLLAAALASIHAQTEPPLEVLVVDNGSADDSERVARQAGATVLQLGSNRGFSYAVNRGIDAARGDLLVLMNNDVELESGWTATLRHALERSGAWFAIGKLLSYARRGEIDGVGDAICRGGTACRLGNARPDGPLFNRSRTTFFPSATAVLLRREFFERVGRLEEAFFAYLEDVDMGLRAALLGLEGVYVPEAVAYHHGSATLGRWNARMVEWTTRNQVLILAKYYPGALLWRFGRSILAAHALWGFLTVLRGCPLAYLRGLITGIRQTAAMRQAGAGWRLDGNRLAKVLTASEAELACFQRQTGADEYWQWYFRLAPRLPETHR